MFGRRKCAQCGEHLKEKEMCLFNEKEIHLKCFYAAKLEEEENGRQGLI